MSLIQGETVVVVSRETEYDELGEPVSDKETRETAFTLCFPKTYAGDLRGRTVEVRGSECRVIGDPQRYTEENTPGDWNLTVEVTRVDG